MCCFVTLSGIAVRVVCNKTSMKGTVRTRLEQPLRSSQIIFVTRTTFLLLHARQHVHMYKWFQGYSLLIKCDVCHGRCDSDTMFVCAIYHGTCTISNHSHAPCWKARMMDGVMFLCELMICTLNLTFSLAQICSVGGDIIQQIVYLSSELPMKLHPSLLWCHKFISNIVRNNSEYGSAYE